MRCSLYRYITQRDKDRGYGGKEKGGNNLGTYKTEARLGLVLT